MPWSTSPTWTCEMIVKTYKEQYKKDPRPAATPCDTSDKLNPEANERTEPQKRVQKMLGMLLWLARSSRYDISHATGMRMSMVHRWDEKCDKALDRLVGYIQRTKDTELKMFCHKDVAWEDLEVMTWTDSSLEVPKSVQSYFTALCSKGYPLLEDTDMSGVRAFLPIAWAANRQSCTASSSAAAEYMAAYDACEQYVWHLVEPSHQFRILIDNNSAITWIRKPTDRTDLTLAVEEQCREDRHDQALTKLMIALAKMDEKEDHAVTFYAEALKQELSKSATLKSTNFKELVDKGIVAPDYVNTKRNLADLGTKALGTIAQQKAAAMIGLVGAAAPQEIYLQ